MFCLSPQSGIQNKSWLTVGRGFPGGSAVQDPPANEGDMGSIPVLGKSLGEGNDNPLQYSCLGNPMDGEAWKATVHGASKESDQAWRLNHKQTTAQQVLNTDLLLEGMKVKVDQSCVILCHPMNYTVHGILQAGHWSG